MPLDLHIHDADFIQYLFGLPTAVCSHATLQNDSITHIHTLYDYRDKRAIGAEGSWLPTPSFGFQMSFDILLEKATVVYDCTCRPTFRLCPADDQPVTPPACRRRRLCPRNRTFCRPDPGQNDRPGDHAGSIPRFRADDRGRAALGDNRPPRGTDPAQSITTRTMETVFWIKRLFLASAFNEAATWPASPTRTKVKQPWAKSCGGKPQAAANLPGGERQTRCTNAHGRGRSNRSFLNLILSFCILFFILGSVRYERRLEFSAFCITWKCFTHP